MNIARIATADGRVSYATVEGDHFRLIAGDVFGDWRPGTSLVARSAARLLAPVAPPQIVAIGLNYRRHAAESGMAVPPAPLIFIKTCNAITGPGEPVLLPKMAPSEVDYEAELVIVIGRTAKHVPEAEVDRYVLGYTCGNDVSARDCQIRLDKQWARGKCFDTFAPIGPWITTGINAEDLAIRMTLNGQVVQNSRTSDLVFSCRQLVSYVSQCMTLLPGSIIMTGTPEGVGMGRKPPLWLKDGDVMTVEIEGIGALTNPARNEA
jgi:2-keto-4-pentenoate hydratase/2-oxohepta-3-ene-1,7-dioic acid hydratase in catechol pathway